MSRTSGLRDFLDIEQRLFADEAAGWCKSCAGIKVFLSVAAIAVNVTVANLRLSIGLFIAAAILIIWSRVPWKHTAVFLLAPVWATLTVAAGYAIGFGATPLFHLGPVTVYEEGARMGAAAAARVACDVAWLAALFLTTPFTEVLDVLRRARVPTVLVDTLAFMYRYIFLIWDEFDRMRVAAKARGGMASRSRMIDTVSRIAAQIFLQAHDRAERIDISIRARSKIQ